MGNLLILGITMQSFLVRQGSQSTPVAVESVSLDQATVEGYVDDTVQLVATVLPANATNKSVTYSSDNEAVATVSSTGLVTIVGESGSCTITAITVDGSFTDTCGVSSIGVLIDQSALDGYVTGIDSYFKGLTLVNYSSGNYTFVMPSGIPASYYSATERATLEGYGCTIALDSTLADTDAILAWYATYIGSLTLSTLNLLSYDARTETSAEDLATIQAAGVSVMVNDPPLVVEPIIYVASAKANTTSSTSLAVAVPAGTIDGDTMLAFVNVNNNEQVINAPVGWDLVTSGTLFPNTTSSSIAVYKRRASSEPTSYQFSGWTATRATIIISVWRNVSLSAIDALGVMADRSSTYNDITLASLTTVSNNAVLVMTVYPDSSSIITTVTAPAGMTQRVYGTTSQDVLMFDENIVSAGATGTRYWQGTINAAKVGLLLALKQKS